MQLATLKNHVFTGMRKPIHAISLEFYHFEWNEKYALFCYCVLFQKFSCICDVCTVPYDLTKLLVYITPSFLHLSLEYIWLYWGMNGSLCISRCNSHGICVVSTYIAFANCFLFTSEYE